MPGFATRILLAVMTAGLLTGIAQAQKPSFQRISSIPVFLNTPGVNEDAKAMNAAVAEIVDASEDGNTLVYTDSENEALGFVDITTPTVPAAIGLVPLAGEPTAVAVRGDFALVGVNTSADFVNTSGKLQVVRISTQTIVQEFELGGQPDSVAVSPDQNYAAIAIENERDEDLGDGRPPQFPPGFVVAFDISDSDPANWDQWDVPLTGIADKFPADPEPEFVDINSNNICAVTLQENNHVVLIDLENRPPSNSVLEMLFNLQKLNIVGDFSCGDVELDQIDILENDLIEQVDFLPAIPREPDAIQWVGNDYLATADEGDLDGGTRGYTIFDADGDVVFTSGNDLEHLTASIGHYPEGRSENKGNEPEGAEFARFGNVDYLFIGSERSSVIFVYRLKGKQPNPQFVQVLPAGLAPEGLKAIPNRDLFVVASEDDERNDKYRSSISIYQLVKEKPTYPTIVSADGDNGVPIPWAALSALAADSKNPTRMYTVYDSFFQQSRIFEIRVTNNKTPEIVEEIVLKQDSQTVNLDPEGLATRSDGTFWLASEGAGTVGDPNRPFETKNLLYEVDTDGTVLSVVELPASLNSQQVRFGFEGVTSVGTVGIDEQVFVCIQREWADDDPGEVKIGKYDVASDTWTFAHYPLDTPTSPNGGWVGLSEIVSIGGNKFLILERDNQAGTDARVKKIYQVDITGVTFETHSVPQAPALPMLTKTLIADLIPALEAPNGAVIEKVEGLTVLQNGDVYIVTDNDGVDDSSGETQLINLGDILP